MPIHATPAIVGAIGVVVASDDGFVRLFNSTLDRLYWGHRLYASVYASLVVDAYRNRVIVATTNGQVRAFDLKGNIEWARNLEHPVFATPGFSLCEDLLALASFNHQGFGLSLDDGSLRYTVTLPAPWHADFNSLSAWRNPFASPAVTPSGDAAICSGNNVFLLDVNGKVKWQKSLASEIKSSPIICVETHEVVITTCAGTVHFLSLEDGKEVANLQLDAKVTASGALCGNRISIGTATGKVWCIDQNSHTALWQSDFGAPRDYTSFTLTPMGDFVATTQSGNAICLAAESGRFLWETSQVLGLDDHDPAMSITPVLGGDGQMYCASYNGDLYQFTFDSADIEVQ